MSDFQERIRTACNVDFIDGLGNDIRVADAARVSFDKREGETLTDRGKRIIRYLAAHDHWTPFGHVIVTLRIEAPIFIARQWFRSSVGVARNEVSRRYVDKSPEYFLPATFNARPDENIKQGAGNLHLSSGWVSEEVRNAYGYADEVYRILIENGVAPEEARMVLPMGHFTAWFETGSLAYYGRVAALRLDRHAQGATRDLAAKVLEAVEPVAPIAVDALLRRSGVRTTAVPLP